MLCERGLMMKEGTIVDATIIEAPPSTKNKDKSRDPEKAGSCCWLPRGVIRPEAQSAPGKARSEANTVLIWPSSLTLRKPRSGLPASPLSDLIDQRFPSVRRHCNRATKSR
jgi:hypothetical protein